MGYTPKPRWARGSVRLNGRTYWSARTPGDLLLTRGRCLFQNWQVSIGRWLRARGT